MKIIVQCNEAEWARRETAERRDPDHVALIDDVAVEVANAIKKKYLVEVQDPTGRFLYAVFEDDEVSCFICTKELPRSQAVLGEIRLKRPYYARSKQRHYFCSDCATSSERPAP